METTNDETYTERYTKIHIYGALERVDGLVGAEVQLVQVSLQDVVPASSVGGFVKHVARVKMSIPVEAGFHLQKTVVALALSQTRTKC